MDTNNLHRLKEIIAIVNNKGGVGKTTTVQSLAAAMVRYRQYWRVLVIDMDPSGDLSKLMGAQPDQMVTPTLTDAMSSSTGRLPIYEHLLQTGGSIYYTPASPELQCIDPALVKQLAPNKVLDRLLHAEPEDLSGHGIGSIEEYFDYVLIDCPPDLSMRTMNAMGAADSLLVPVQMEGLPVNALAPILNQLKEVRELLNAKLVLRGILPTMVDTRPNISRGFMDYLRKAYGERVMHTVIPREIKVTEAQTKKQDVFEYGEKLPRREKQSAANAYDELVREMFQH